MRYKGSRGAYRDCEKASREGQTILKKQIYSAYRKNARKLIPFRVEMNCVNFICI